MEEQAEAEGWAEEEGQVEEADLVLIGANIGTTEVHTTGATLEELYKHHDKEVVGYRARISFLESKVAAHTMREDGSSGSGPIVPRDKYLQSLQAEKDVAIEEARNEKLHATQISTANQEMQVMVDALQREVEELCYQLESANCLVVEYEATRDKIEELEEENGRLKKYFLESLEERKKMRTSTLLAIARARNMKLSLKAFKVNGIAIIEYGI